MELRQLRYFVGVAEVGSFTKAAAVLDIAQPALSRQIRELEIELGVALLVRNGRGVVLTDAGVKFLGRAKMILDDTERALQEARSLKGRPMGMVSVGLPPSIGTILSVPTVVRVRKLYPEIQLQLTEGYSGHIHEWLLSGRLDIGVLYIPQRNAEANFDRLANEQLYLLGAPDVIARHLGQASSIEFSETPKLPLILPTRPHAIRRLMDEIAAKKHIEFILATEINAFLAIRDLVLSGHGLTILPVSNVLPEIGSGRLKAVRITDPELMQTVGLMMSTHHTPSLATATVARVIHDLARELVNTAAWPEKYDKSLAGKSRAAAAKARSAR
jgi:LysR family nitrogen assimilation transcriptional regulator